MKLFLLSTSLFIFLNGCTKQIPIHPQSLGNFNQVFPQGKQKKGESGYIRGKHFIKTSPIIIKHTDGSETFLKNWLKLKLVKKNGSTNVLRKPLLIKKHKNIYTVTGRTERGSDKITLQFHQTQIKAVYVIVDDKVKNYIWIGALSAGIVGLSIAAALYLPVNFIIIF
jgi:hypothetical protein